MAEGGPLLALRGVCKSFGGVQAVARDPRSGALSGGGDPRRGGAVAYA